ncbi:MAG: 3'-5' exonuclease [Acidaminococcaceae bacterium]|nr:3'-5' exonuclease [Acidaminococcaceae bacterium]
MEKKELTAKQRQIALAKKKRKNWRKQVQAQVNKNEIVTPRHCSLVVFDLEGAGFLEEDITEIAAVRVSPFGDVLEVYQQLIKPITKLNKKVVAITGITEEMLADKPSMPDVLVDFFAFVGDSTVLGHDIGYNDIMNINMACRRFRRKNLFLPRFLDTERIAKRLLPTETGGKFGLDALMKYYNLHANGEHRALADCYSALSVYQCLIQEFQNKKPF